jgi:outer membrane protein assembly factor BamA
MNPGARRYATARRQDTVPLVIFAFSVALISVTSVASVAAQAERITEIRIHGNHTTPDADILALSGLATGDEASPERLRDAEQKLKGAGRFEGVELRRRYLSIADPSQILVMIVIDEHPAVSATDLTPGPMKKLGSASMWLPILHHQDGYGLTYGARVSFNEVLGGRSRVSVPMTWGGERRIALEAERLFSGPISVLKGGVSVYRRVNPHFEQPDLRQEARVEAERTLTDWLRVGADARVAAVSFGPDYDARHTAGGLHAVVDTRIDPSFPRNAVHARMGWERLAFPAGQADRWLTDVRGYVGIGGSRVLALRGQMARSNTALPFAEQPMLGGSDSLRGYATGYRAGDNMAAGTIEVRQPLNSPLSAGRFGVKAFVDAGTTWGADRRMGDQPFDRGIGGGVYFGIGPFMMDLDVAKPEEGRPRAHFGMGVTF